MIRLNKKEKPEILSKNEKQWLEDLMEYINAGQKPLISIQRRYAHKDIKRALIEETFEKCAYCESKITHIDYGDIEHIEPKSIVPEKTFDWNNLTLSCGKCNQNKGTYHNLTMTLLNPYIDDVENEIIFLGPIPSARSQRASLTVKLLKLDRVELIERRKVALERIQPLIDIYLREEGELKELIYRDLVNYAKKDVEFSSMMKSVVDTIKSPFEELST